ncbi:MAG: hydantoinase B/oxoprolinase family protein, partial [Deltaproteobacteria bacterium]|nr:hydantoinase B/oxoprolinase family protein [Deltaproteobacteria bacterium]
MAETDPITLEIIDSRLDEVVGEMQEILYHTGYSTIIRESKDASAAITTAAGEVVGQAIRLPLHAGVF